MIIENMDEIRGRMIRATASELGLEPSAVEVMAEAEIEALVGRATAQQLEREAKAAGLTPEDFIARQTVRDLRDLSRSGGAR